MVFYVIDSVSVEISLNLKYLYCIMQVFRNAPDILRLVGNVADDVVDFSSGCGGFFRSGCVFFGNGGQVLYHIHHFDTGGIHLCRIIGNGGDTLDGYFNATEYIFKDFSCLVHLGILLFHDVFDFFHGMYGFFGVIYQGADNVLNGLG